METNSIITNRLPVSGALRKAYKESIIVLCGNLKFGYAYKNQLFINIETGHITWGDDEEEYLEIIKDSHYKKVELISILPVNQTSAFIEIIDPEILRMHLVEEAALAREMMDTNKLDLK